VTSERLQCTFCGYLLDWGVDVCRVCHPHSELPEHVQDEIANAHLRGILFFNGKDDAVVREASLWEEGPFLEEEVRLALGRMEDVREIERFAGYYRVLRHPEASA
jgi:hypothetical protein